MTEWVEEREPEQMYPDGAAVLYRRDDGHLGTGTVRSYDRESGRFKIQTKVGVVTRFWVGVWRVPK